METLVSFLWRRSSSLVGFWWSQAPLRAYPVSEDLAINNVSETLDAVVCDHVPRPSFDASIAQSGLRRRPCGLVGNLHTC